MPLSLPRVFHGIRFYFKESGTVKSRFSALKAELFLGSALKAELFTKLLLFMYSHFDGASFLISPDFVPKR